VLLEIPDEADESIVNARINAKIKFFWSEYKYYEDLYNACEKKLKNLKLLLDKSYQLLENLNGKIVLTIEPFRSMEEDRTEEIKRQRNLYVQNELESDRATMKKEQAPTIPPLEQQIAESIETTIQKNLSILL
jgi:hypothetical protein